MATKLSQADLPELLSWLHNYLPASFTIYHELRSHLRGKFPHLDFYVDRWPDPQAAAAVIDPAGEQLKGQEFHKDSVIGVFGVTEKAQVLVLQDERVVDWTRSVIFNDLPVQCEPAISTVAKEKGATLHSDALCLLKATKHDLHCKPVPGGMKTSPISEEDVDIVGSTWTYSARGTAGYIRDQIQHFPSVVLKSRSGEHVGHMLGQTCGTLGLLYVVPAFRGKGYAKVIVSQLATQYVDEGEDVYVLVEVDNHVSISLHQSLGFMTVPGPQMCYITCSPAIL